MKKRHVCLIVACLILLGQGLIMAQTLAGTPSPKVLWIFREDVKVAKGAIHRGVERGFAQFWSKAQIQPFIAMEAMSGNPTEVIFMSGYDSFASFEKDYLAFGKATGGPLKAEYDALTKQEAELVNNARSLVAIFRPDLSYRPDQIMPNLPKARYAEITVMRTRPGKAEAFAYGAKLYQSAYEKANIHLPWAIYEAAEGAPSGTFFVLTAFTSLKEIDDMLAAESKILAAMGGPGAIKSMNAQSADIFVSIESNMYLFSPEMSHVPKEFAAVDPEFWIPKAKAAPASTGAPKKTAK
jgi:hypothetical protein